MYILFNDHPEEHCPSAIVILFSTSDEQKFIVKFVGQVLRASSLKLHYSAGACYTRLKESLLWSVGFYTGLNEAFFVNT